MNYSDAYDIVSLSHPRSCSLIKKLWLFDLVLSLRTAIITWNHMTITVSTMKGSLGVNKKNLFSCECDSCITVRYQGLELMGYILMKSWLDYRGVLYNTPPESQRPCPIEMHFEELFTEAGIWTAPFRTGNKVFHTLSQKNTSCEKSQHKEIRNVFVWLSGHTASTLGRRHGGEVQFFPRPWPLAHLTLLAFSVSKRICKHSI